MYQRADDRIQCPDDSQSNRNKIQRHGKGHIELDRRHHAF